MEQERVGLCRGGAGSRGRCGDGATGKGNWARPGQWAHLQVFVGSVVTSVNLDLNLPVLHFGALTHPSDTQLDHKRMWYDYTYTCPRLCTYSTAGVAQFIEVQRLMYL